MADSIKFNLGKGDSLKINSTKTFMKGVEQNANGGKIEHHATEELTQIGNSMEAKNDGQIINEVEGGALNQIDNKMKVDDGGKIINKVSKKDIKLPIILILLGVFADMTSLYFFGLHFWEKIEKLFS